MGRKGRRKDRSQKVKRETVGREEMVKPPGEIEAESQKIRGTRERPPINKLAVDSQRYSPKNLERKETTRNGRPSPRRVEEIPCQIFKSRSVT